MIIDTNNRVIRIQLRRLSTMIFCIFLIVTIMIIGKLPNTFLGLNKYQWALVIGAIYFVALILEGLLGINYVYFSDDSDKIVLRYFSLSYLSRIKRSIEIPKNEFSSYQLVEEYWGLKRKIILKRMFKKTEAKYPAVNISILKTEELIKLTTALDSYCKL